MIINLTPHSIIIYTRTTPACDSSSTWTLPTSGTIARAAEHARSAESIGGIPTTRTTFGVVDGLPAPSEGTYYVVSALAADAAHRSGRSTVDLLVPGQQIRDAHGRIVGCASLCRWEPARATEAQAIEWIEAVIQHSLDCRTDCGESDPGAMPTRSEITSALRRLADALRVDSGPRADPILHDVK